METSELREKNIDELKRLEHELSRKLFDLRLKHSIGKLRETADLRKMRKDIARVKTVLSSKVKGERKGLSFDL